MPGISGSSSSDDEELMVELISISPLEDCVCAGLQENNNDDESILPQYIGILLTASHLGHKPRDENLAIKTSVLRTSVFIARFSSLGL